MQCPHGDIHYGLQINVNLTDDSPTTLVIPLTTGINDTNLQEIADALNISKLQLETAMQNHQDNPHLRYLYTTCTCKFSLRFLCYYYVVATCNFV
jgi:hypothetical protein